MATDQATTQVPQDTITRPKKRRVLSPTSLHRKQLERLARKPELAIPHDAEEEEVPERWVPSQDILNSLQGKSEFFSFFFFFIFFNLIFF